MTYMLQWEQGEVWYHLSLCAKCPTNLARVRHADCGALPAADDNDRTDRSPPGVVTQESRSCVVMFELHVQMGS